MINVSIVIVNYNSGSMLAECVQSIESFANNKDVEIIIIDNNSQDTSMELLPHTKVPLKIIRNSFNAGFPYACNQGIQLAQGNIILLLNPDSRIDELTIPLLLEGFKINLVGICTIAQTDGQHKFVPCYKFPSVVVYLRSLLFKQPVIARLAPISLTSLHHWFRVDGYISGACLAITRQTIERIGLMDEALFWAEDADWCKRALDCGILIGYSDEASLFHHRSAIAKKHLNIALYYQYVSKIRYLRKHQGNRATITLQILITLEILIKWVLAYRLLLKPTTVDQAHTRMRAYRAVLKQLWLAIPADWEKWSQ